MQENEEGYAREPEILEADILPQTQCLSAVVKKYNEVGVPRRTSIIQPKTNKNRMGLKQFPKLNQDLNIPLIDLHLPAVHQIQAILHTRSIPTELIKI